MSESIVDAITNDFCEAFVVRNDFVGAAARLVAAGVLPRGVNPADHRVQLITMLCRVGEDIPRCRSCQGAGMITAGQSRDFCADCVGGAGVQHPDDKTLTKVP